MPRLWPVFHEVRLCTAMLLLSCFPVSGAAATSATAQPEPGPISDALCGRVANKTRTNLARALDKFDSSSIPPEWRQMEIQNFQRWLEARVCAGASKQQAELYRSRHQALARIGQWLQRAEVMEKIGSALKPFRGWRPGVEEWPRSSECTGCTDLRSAAARVADIAARWPSPSSTTKLGARLAEATERAPLVGELCLAKPSRGARAEIEHRFQYYTWTAEGAKLLEIASFFEQPEVAAGCQDR